MRFPLTLLCFSIVTSATANELLFPNSDFESGTLAGWTATGNAFAVQPTKGDNTSARGRESSNHAGDYWIGTYEKYDGQGGEPGTTRGDRPTGTLTSPEFTITKPFITFLVGGGNLPGETGVRLVCDGEEIDLATGGDSEEMFLTSSDVSRLLGKRARLVVYDQATTGWGHINVDEFRAADQPAIDKGMEFAWTDGISREAYPDTGYDQPLRPQFHFSSRRNWLNDPNGMVFDGARYHLFFQHNPKGSAWGNMTWGHATSPDMVHWRQRDHALLPYRVDRRSGTIFSGTAVVDHQNSLGKQVGDTKTLVAFFTFANKPKFYQAMAYSTDGGETWTYWNEGRPVVDAQGFRSDERDPKVFWHEDSRQWVMVLWVQSNPGRIRFFTSPNLTDWSVASDLMRDWAFECMDLVFLPVDGNQSELKAVLYDASFDYEIGTFDGKVFHSESRPLRAGGGNFYAAQTFNQAPDGRVVQVGWMRGGPNVAQEHGLPYNQQMSFPCELSLKTTDDGVRLYCWPIEEIDSLVRNTHNWTDVALAPNANLLEGIAPLDLVDLSINFDPGTAKQIAFELPGVKLVYDAQKQILTQTGVNDDGTSAIVVVLSNLAPRNGKIQLRLLIDRLSVEAFAFGGEHFRAHYYSPKHGSGGQSIEAIGGAAHLDHLEVRELNSAW